MKIKHITHLLCAVFAMLLLSACTGTLLLPKGDRLYIGAKVKVKAADKDWETGAVEAALPSSVVLPRPNRQLLWLRGGVAIYNTFHKADKEKGLGNKIAKTLGKPPVLYTENITATHQKKLIATAADFGFFDVKVETKQAGNRKKVKLKHTVHLLRPPKIFGNLNFPPDTGAVERRLLQLKSSTLLKPGLPYNFLMLKLERQRLTDTLRNEGWFFLSPEQLLFEADTLAHNGDVELTLRFKDDVTAVEKRRYRIGEILIYPDYDLRVAGELGQQMTQVDDCIGVVFSENNIKHSLIIDNIRFRCGEYFSNEKYRASLFRLLNLQFYKFVNIRFEESVLSDSLLEAYVYLTPAVPQKVEVTLSGIFSNYYYGAQTGLTWQHRNVFGGAENLRLAWEGALLQLTDKSTLFSSDTKTQLTLPQKIPGIRNRQKNALSATKFSLAHNLLFLNVPVDSVDKISLGIHELEGEGGFVWKKNRQGTITHELNPFNVALNFVQISDTRVKEMLLEDILIATTDTELEDALFFATLVKVRPNYGFVYDNRLASQRKLSMLFRQKFSFLSSRYLLPEYIASAANLSFSLNFFTESDLRQYYKVAPKTTLAWRASVFAGLPLRQGSIIPPTDLYTIGGASSLRAFAPRSIGPGSSVIPIDTTFDGVLSLLTDHTGNLQLLGNVELRRQLAKSWEVAVFLDAGNVWQTEADAELPGSEFSLSRFYKELASDVGAGLRFTLGFFILRLDFAIPVSKPYLPDGSRLIGQPGFGSTSVRLNFAFGYPF